MTEPQSPPQSPGSSVIGCRWPFVDHGDRHDEPTTSLGTAAAGAPVRAPSAQHAVGVTLDNPLRAIDRLVERLDSDAAAVGHLEFVNDLLGLQRWSR